MRFTSASLFLLVLAACQPQSASAPPAAETAAATAPAPAPDSLEYVAEDPRLTKLTGEPGPAIKLQTLDGQTIDLKQLYGKKPVYLKLWATYCMPCRAQMPGFEKIYETYGADMEVIAVNAGVGDDAEKVRAFAERSNMHMPNTIDDGALGAWIKLQGTPLHIIIGRDGRVIHAGHQDSPQLYAAIEKAIAAPASTGSISTVDVANVTALRPGDAIPAITLRDSHSQPVQLKSGATSQPRAILFTSVWCESYLKATEPESVPVCRRAREDVDRLAKAGDVEWLGIASHLWTDEPALAAYEAESNPQLPMALDADGEAFRTFGIRRFPAIALIDRSGHLVRVLGPDESDIAAAVQALAKDGSPQQ